MAKLKEHVEQEVDAINVTASHIVDDIELPKVVIPEALDGGEEAPEPLIDSEWDFVHQCQRLIISKQEFKDEQELP